MKIVYIKNDRSATIERDRTDCTCFRCCRIAGSNPLKELDRTRLTVNSQFKIFTLQRVDEMAVLVKDHHVSLHQSGGDSHYVIAFRRFRFLIGLSQSLRSQCKQNDEDANQ